MKFKWRYLKFSYTFLFHFLNYWIFSMIDLCLLRNWVRIEDFQIIFISINDWFPVTTTPIPLHSHNPSKYFSIYISNAPLLLASLCWCAWLCLTSVVDCINFVPSAELSNVAAIDIYIYTHSCICVYVNLFKACHSLSLPPLHSLVNIHFHCRQRASSSQYSHSEESAS